MKTLKITPPDGHEIDKDKSSFEQIVFKKIEKELPISVDDIRNRKHYIDSFGRVIKLTSQDVGINNLSTKERAEAFLALMQLVELRDYVNGDWKPDWEKINNKYVITVVENKIKPYTFTCVYRVLHFKSEKLRDKFSEKYSDLIEQAKELL